MALSPFSIFGQWNLLPNGETDGYFNDLYFVNEDTGFVCHSSGTLQNVILRTLDGGQSWDTTNVELLGLSPITGAPMGVHFVNDSVGFVLTMLNIIKTTDCGDTWFEIDTANSFGGGGAWRDIHFINQDTGFVGWADGGGGLMISVDGGWNWDTIPGYAIRQFNEYNNVITACNGGWSIVDSQTAQWTQYIPPIFGAVHYRNSLYHEGKLIIIGHDTGTGNGIYGVSSDWGANWDLRYTVGELEDIHFVNDTLGHLCGGFLGTFRTNDGGETWYDTEIDNMGTGALRALREIQFLNDSIGYGISWNGIYKTTNGGGTSQAHIDFWPYDLSFVTNQDLKLKVYPNPAFDHISVQSNGLTINQVIIYNLAGQQVLETTTSAEINIWELESGTYIVQVHSEQGVFTERLVKR